MNFSDLPGIGLNSVELANAIRFFFFVTVGEFVLVMPAVSKLNALRLSDHCSLNV